MKATARRENGKYKHDVEIRGHNVVADEPEDSGGDDASEKGSQPIQLSRCTSSACDRLLSNRLCSSMCGEESFWTGVD